MSFYWLTLSLFKRWCLTQTVIINNGYLFLSLLAEDDICCFSWNRLTLRRFVAFICWLLSWLSLFWFILRLNDRSEFFMFSICILLCQYYSLISFSYLCISYSLIVINSSICSRIIGLLSWAVLRWLLIVFRQNCLFMSDFFCQLATWCSFVNSISILRQVNLT